MGIKTEVTQDELPLKYQKFTLRETTDGLTHSVYLLGNEYVLKIVEGTTQNTILNEQKLLDSLETLYVPKLLDIYVKENYTMVFYSQMCGESISNVTGSHIKQIALFLKEFHGISKELSSSNEKICSEKAVHTR